MNQPDGRIENPSGPAAAARLEMLAFALLLACLVARPFLGEIAYRTNSISAAVSSAVAAQVGQTPSQGAAVDHSELFRVTFSIILLLAAVAWAAASALRGKIEIRHWPLAAIGGLFAVWSLISAFKAANVRVSLDAWLEQVSLIAAVVTAVQLFSNRRRMGVLLVLLGALAGTMAIKAAYQVLIETPDNIQFFEMYKDQALLRINAPEASPQAMAFENRLHDWSATGFLRLSNVFASLMILLSFAAAALAAAKFVFAKKDRAASKTVRGQIHLPTLAAIISAVLAACAVAALALSRSRGGMAAAGAAAATAIAIAIWGGRLAKHWKAAAIVVGGLLLAGVVAVGSYGLKNDQLPGRSMTFRWHYWTATAEIIRDNPIWGVGGGNFPAYYLQYRRAGAEEAVKDPHNVVLNSLVQYGVAGGVLLLAAIVYLLFNSFRPINKQDEISPPAQGSQKSSPGRTAMIIALPPLAAMLAKFAAGNVESPAFAFFEVFLPCAVLCLMIVACLWNGPKLEADLLDAAPGRIILACALVGFFIHGMVELNFSAPATATVFWICAGACCGFAGRGCVPVLTLQRRAAWTILAGGILALAVLIAAQWLPVYRRTMLLDRTLEALDSRDLDAAARCAAAAADADKLDAQAAGDAALVISAQAQRQTKDMSLLDDALAWANRAIQLDPADAANALIKANVLDAMHRREPNGGFNDRSLIALSRAVSLDPMNIRMRLSYAAMLSSVGKAAQAKEQALRVLELNSKLLPDSNERLRPDELAKTNKLANGRD